MSWGYKILIVYVSFVVMILGMVYVASRQTNEMQDENYYAKELVYQTVIDGKNNLNALTEKVKFISTKENLEITLPITSFDNISEGHIRLLRPSEQRKDIDISLAINKDGQQFIPLTKFSKGLYKLQLSWKNSGKDFYFEDNVYI